VRPKNLFLVIHLLFLLIKKGKKMMFVCLFGFVRKFLNILGLVKNKLFSLNGAQ
jgi:hypothetical protein